MNSNETIINQVQPVKKGMIPAIIGCISGVLAILTIGVVFFPIALICTIIAFIFSIKSKYGAAIAVSCLSLILTIAGFVFSPTLWLLVFGSQAINSPEFQEGFQQLKEETQQLQRELNEQTPNLLESDTYTEEETDN